MNYGESSLPSHAFHAPGFVLLVKFFCILFSHLSSLLSIKDFKMMGSDRNVLIEFTFIISLVLLSSLLSLKDFEMMGSDRNN